MALTPGTRLGPYIVVGGIGSGGMGEVYRVTDTRLDRDVALKLLPETVAGDPERRSRFEREAKAIASLNHSGIVTIHSIEDVDGVHFLTMELVDGRTLADIVPPQGLALDRLLKIAIPLTDAVSAAHQRGITHRDLKPANVMVTADGHVKVLDFGLAKLQEDRAPAAGLTMTAGHATGEGKIVGTVAYMSPEQGEGRPVDHRSDLFSLGIILYEMATGMRPFQGDTNVSVLSSIIKDTPRPISAVRPHLPPEFGKIVKRCLVKDPDRRYQSAKDLRNELEELGQDLSSGEIAMPLPAPSQRRGLPWGWVAGGAVVIAIAAIGGTKFLGPAESGPTAVAATFMQLTFQPGIEHAPSLSPDGKWLVYNAAVGDEGNFDIFLQAVGGHNAINLTKDWPGADIQPAFSADGEQIVFRSDRQGGGLFVMGRTGESTRRVTDTGFNPAWSPDGKEIVYSTASMTFNPYGRQGTSELWVANVASGERRQLFKGDAVAPRWSPHGHRIAFWSVRLQGSSRDIMTIAASGGEPTPVTQDTAVDFDPEWSPDGRHLFFASDRGGSLNLWRVPIDETTGAPGGEPEPVTTPASSVARPSVSSDGRKVAYLAVTLAMNLQRYALDAPAGVVKDAGTWVTTGSQMRGDVDVSPDGKRLAFQQGLSQEDLFVSGLDGSSAQQLTNDPGRDRMPRWSPDGERIAYYSVKSGKYEVWSIRADGSDAKQLTDTAPAVSAIYPVWSPTGERMGMTDIRKFEVFLFDPRRGWKDQTPEKLPAPPGGAFSAWSWSADGRWIAGPGQRGLLLYDTQSRQYTPLTSLPDTLPQWLTPARLAFIRGGQLWTLDIRSRDEKPLLTIAPAVIYRYAVSRDGKQLYIAHSVSEGDIWLATIK